MRSTSAPSICALCGGDRSVLHLETPGQLDASRRYRLLRCGVCGLIRLADPLPDEEMIERSGDYQRVIRETLEAVRATWAGRIGLGLVRRRRWPGAPAGRRLLDIGCSSGTYLAWLRSQGWTVAGIEYDPAAAEIARAQRGLDVQTGDAVELLSAHEVGSFDVITMWHVLEHVRDPCRLVAEARRALRPGGFLMIETPNAGSVWTKLFGRDWFPWETPFHTFHFTPETLREVCTRAGLASIELEGTPAPAEILWSLQHRWGRLRNRPPGRLWWSSAFAVAFYPLEWLLARFARSNHMRVRARV